MSNHLTLKDIVLVTFYACSMLLIVTGNCIIILVILIRKKLRNSTNLFLTSLSSADLLIGIYVLPSSIAHTVNGSTALTINDCTFALYVQSASICASVFSLLVISIDRFIAVLRPSLKGLSNKQSIILIAVTWLLAFGYSAKIFVTEAAVEIVTGGNGTLSNDQNEVPIKDFCNIYAEYETDDLWIRVLDTIVLFLIPLLFMVVLYSRVVHKLRRSRTSLNQTVRKQGRAVKMFIVVVTLFSICWFPFHAMEILFDSGIIKNNTTFIILKFVATQLAISNSWVNPIIYGYYNTNFREPILLAIQKCCICKKSQNAPNAVGPSSGACYINSTQTSNWERNTIEIATVEAL